MTTFFASSFDPGFGDRRADAYGPVSGWQTEAAYLPTARFLHSVAAVDGRLYLFGGHGGRLLSRVDIYRPATDRGTAGTPMPDAMGGMAVATYLEASGRTVVYLIGGSTGMFGTGVASNRRFDPGPAE